MQLLLTNKKGTWDVTALVPSIKWSGDYQQVARTLECSLVCSASDQTVPAVDCALGSGVQLKVGGELLFDGTVRARTRSTGGNMIDLVCYDRGFELRKNKVLKVYEGKTAKQITEELASLFSIPIGKLANPGLSITRNFVTGSDSIDDVIRTAYTLAARSNGKAYHVGFRGKKLYVSEKKADKRTLIIEGGSNLIAASTTESVENMVNAVQIYDANDRFVREVKNASDIKAYGRMQEILKQTKEDNKSAEAQTLLDDNGLTQRITVDCLGNVANVTGGCVVVREPHTGLYGLFWIDSDVHEWKRGQYYNKLVLNFKKMVDEKEAGSLPNATGQKTAGGSNGLEGGYGWDEQ